MTQVESGRSYHLAVENAYVRISTPPVAGDFSFVHLQTETFAPFIDDLRLLTIYLTPWPPGDQYLDDLTTAQLFVDIGGQGASGAIRKT